MSATQVCCQRCAACRRRCRSWSLNAGRRRATCRRWPQRRRCTSPLSTMTRTTTWTTSAPPGRTWGQGRLVRTQASQGTCAHSQEVSAAELLSWNQPKNKSTGLEKRCNPLGGVYLPPGMRREGFRKCGAKREMVFHQGGLIRAASYQGGLSSHWEKNQR